MKIMHIASGDLWGGAESQLFTLAKQLYSTSGLELTIVLLNHGKLEQLLKEEGISIIVLDESKNNTFKLIFALYKHIKRINPDVVHTHRTKENIIGSISCLLSGKRISVRTTHGESEHKLTLYQFWKSFYNHLDNFCFYYLQKANIAVSDDLAYKLKKSSKARDKIVCIENGVDYKEIISTSASSTPKFPGTPNKINICIICRLVPVKRVDIFIKIAIKSNELHPNKFNFYIIGDGPLYSPLSELITNNNAVDYIHMLGFIENVYSYLKQMQLLCITSDHEGLPMNLLEALALHVPVLSNNLTSINKVLGNGAYGYLVDNQNIDTYLQILEEYITQREKFINKSAKGYKVLISKYSSDACAKQYISLYNSLLNRKR